MVLLLLGGVLFVVLTFTSIPTYVAGAAGHVAAHWDAAWGRYKVILPRAYARKETQAFLMMQYGIDTRLPFVSCCGSPPEAAAYDSAYQSVIRKAINARYGRDVAAESMADWKGPFSGRRTYELHDFMDEMRTTFSSGGSYRSKAIIDTMERSLARLDPTLDQASKDKLTEVLDTCLLDNKSSKRHTTLETKYAAIYALRLTGGDAALRVLERLSKEPDPAIAKAAINAADDFE